MRYSDVKPIVKKLRSAGGSKIKGISGYRKIWRKGNMRYGQMISVEELYYSKVPNSDILAYYEEKAVNELNDWRS